MRKRFRVLILAAIVAAVVVPVGFALSLDSGPVVTNLTPSPASIVASSSAAPVVVNPGGGMPLMPDIPDGAKLFAVGTMLFGLAAAVRKAA